MFVKFVTFVTLSYKIVYSLQIFYETEHFLGKEVTFKSDDFKLIII
jgi:hypothetical protein